MRRLGTRGTIGILLALIAWGVLLRLWDLGGRPFWRDEAWVATCIRDLPYTQFWRQTDVPLPPLFGAAVKFVGQFVGPPEVGWRLLPALCGILVLPLLYLVTRQLRAPRTLALAATGLAATSIALVTWSRDLKHYSYEALVSVLVVWLVLRLRGRIEGLSRYTLPAALFALCAVSPWYAYGSIIPISTMLALLLFSQPTAGTRSRLVLVAIAGLVVLALSTYAVWFTVARAQASDPTLANYTKMWCIEISRLHSWMRVGAYVAAATAWLILPAPWVMPLTCEADVVMLVVAAIGIWVVTLLGLCTWPRRGRRALACWIFAPLLLMFALALLQKYPLGVMRMMQFWVPPMLIALAAGIIRISRGVWTLVTRRSALGLATGVCVALLPSLYVVREPLEHRYYVYHDFPTVLRALDQQRAAGEWVFVCWNAVPCIRHYAPNLAPPVAYTPIAGGTILKLGTQPDALFRSTAKRAGHRFWILLAAGEGSDPDRTGLLKSLEAEGFSAKTIQRGGLEGPPSGLAELLLATRK